MSGATGAVANGLREIDMTPIVVNEAVANLQAAGIEVIRRGAFYNGSNLGMPVDRDLDLAISLHFDGNPSATAQAIYDDATDKPATDLWKQMFGKVWPFGFLEDNTTPLADATGYARYYAFDDWFTKDAEMVLELGSIGNAEQAAWLARPGVLPWLGDCVQRFVRRRLGLLPDVEMVPFELSPYNPAPPPPPIVVVPDPRIAELEEELRLLAVDLLVEQARVRAVEVANEGLNERLAAIKDFVEAT